MSPGFEWHACIITEVSEAVDVIEGAQIACMQIRSMHDVLLAQNHKRPLPFDHNFERSSFLSLELPDNFTSRAVGTLQIWGKRGLGKIEWALSQFEMIGKPLLTPDLHRLCTVNIRLNILCVHVVYSRVFTPYSPCIRVALTGSVI